MMASDAMRFRHGNERLLRRIPVLDDTPGNDHARGAYHGFESGGAGTAWNRCGLAPCSALRLAIVSHVERATMASERRRTAAGCHVSARVVWHGVRHGALERARTVQNRHVVSCRTSLFGSRCGSWFGSFRYRNSVMIRQRNGWQDGRIPAGTAGVRPVVLV
jgi:hypothetical protein